MSYWNKDKQNNSFQQEKNKTNRDQSLSSSLSVIKDEKSLYNLLIIKQFNNIIDYKNIKLLRAFLNKYGKICSRKKSHITVQKQREISKAIRKSRAVGLMPFTCDFKN